MGSTLGASSMADYRLYNIIEGRIASARDFQCDDDEAAVERARQLAAGRPVELWQGARLVRRIEPAAD